MPMFSCKNNAQKIAGFIAFVGITLLYASAYAVNLPRPIGIVDGVARADSSTNIQNGLVTEDDSRSMEKPILRDSLFDQLFLRRENGTEYYDIPFPFSKVISRLEASLGISINGDTNLVKSVLIPLGRCINRYAASPNYFEHPRVVIGVDSEHYGDEGRDLAFLKDKIFIGYQEMANSMEVISYSQDSGRFEFQVVNEYMENNRPEVRYVEPERCTGCHQNNGPIFSQPPWDETNNNREVFNRLIEVIADSDQELPVFRGSDASSLDGSSNRANLYSLYQLFWQGVCETNSVHDLIRCRAAIFEMVLRHRLQDNQRTLAFSNRIYDYLYPSKMNGIKDKWPHGISILSSDIYNEDPIGNGAQLHLMSARKLFYPRSLMIKWQPENLFRVIEGLGQFLSLSDIKHLDKLLYKQTAGLGSARVKINGNCQLKGLDDGLTTDRDFMQAGEVSIQCELKEGVFSKPYHFLGDLYLESGNIKSFPLGGRLVIDGPGTIMGLTHQGGTVESLESDWVIKIDLLDSKQQFHARLPGGEILQAIEIRWPKSTSHNQLFSGDNSVTGTAVLTALSAHEILDDALSAMIVRADTGISDLFSSKPFRGKMLMDGLFRELE